MKILVCITHVPDTTSKISFTENNTQLNKNGIQYIIGPYDDYAIARAVELKEQLDATVTVLNVGTSETETSLRKALAIGVDDAIRVNAEPTDSLFVAQQIAKVVKENDFNLVLMGRESIDFNSGLVHYLTANLLGWIGISPVVKLDIENNTAKIKKEIDGGFELLEAPFPLVLGCQEPIAEWKIPNMRGIMSAKNKPLKVIEPESNDVLVEDIKFSLPPEKKGIKMFNEDNLDELINMLKSEVNIL